MNRIKFGCKIQPFQVVRVEGGGEGGGAIRPNRSLYGS